MKTKMKIGKDDYIKACKKAEREIDLENSIGWNATHKVHKTNKDYKRKSKYKTNYLDQD
jgi:hypothetical protein